MNLHSYWTMTRTLTLSQMKARYRRTFAGFFWVIMNPTIMFSAQAIVFKSILKINMANYPIFLLGGLLPWIFITSSLDMGIPTLVNSRQLLVAFKVQPVVVLSSSLLDNWINFLAAFLLVLIPTLALSGVVSPGLLLLPFVVIVLLAGVAGVVGYLALLNVFYRDVRFLVHFIINVLFFLTPIFYPPQLIPENIRWLIDLNPLYLLIKPIRECIYAFSPGVFFPSFAKSIIVASLMLGLASYYWKKRKNEFYHYL
ncbi:MAG: ABC transporter permease [Oligoflexia bacterium]|nr:ABC transporter permease [Oligoflexia bacterium]